MGSAHRLTMVNILSKFNENPSRGKGDNYGETGNKMLNTMAFNFDLEPAY